MQEGREQGKERVKGEGVREEERVRQTGDRRVGKQGNGRGKIKTHGMKRKKTIKHDRRDEGVGDTSHNDATRRIVHRQ